MQTDVPQSWQSRIRRLSRYVVAIWIVCMVAGGTLDLVYQRYAGPAWISAVLVHLFQALALCSMGLFVLGLVYAPPAGLRLGRVLRICAVIFGVITLLLGLWGVWGAGANLLRVLGY